MEESCPSYLFDVIQPPPPPCANVNFSIVELYVFKLEALLPIELLFDMEFLLKLSTYNITENDNYNTPT